MPGHISFKDKVNALGMAVQANSLALTGKLKGKTGVMTPQQQLAFDRVFGGRGVYTYAEAKEHLEAKMRQKREHAFASYGEAREFLDLFDPDHPTPLVAVTAAEWATYLRPGGLTDVRLRNAYTEHLDVRFIMRNSDTAALKRIERYAGAAKSASLSTKTAVFKGAVQTGASKIDALKQAMSTKENAHKWEILWSAA